MSTLYVINVRIIDNGRMIDKQNFFFIGKIIIEESGNNYEVDKWCPITSEKEGEEVYYHTMSKLIVLGKTYDEKNYAPYDTELFNLIAEEIKKNYPVLSNKNFVFNTNMSLNYKGEEKKEIFENNAFDCTKAELLLNV